MQPRCHLSLVFAALPRNNDVFPGSVDDVVSVCWDLSHVALLQLALKDLDAVCIFYFGAFSICIEPQEKGRRQVSTCTLCIADTSLLKLSWAKQSLPPAASPLVENCMDSKNVLDFFHSCQEVFKFTLKAPLQTPSLSLFKLQGMPLLTWDHLAQIWGTASPFWSFLTRTTEDPEIKSSFALVVKEPWASLLVTGQKTLELRKSHTKKTGRIAIASKGSGLLIGEVQLEHSTAMNIDDITTASVAHCVPLP
jgi:hypothetical protein